MELSEVKRGLRVRTGKLESTKGMIVPSFLLNARREGAEGKVLAFVPGHGGDVWTVEHDDGTVAPYCFTEFEVAGAGPGGELR